MLSDPGLGVYKKLVIADGRLTGAVLFGDTADGLWYLDLIRSGADDRRRSATTSRSAARSPNARHLRRRDWRRDMSGDFSPEQKRYLEGFVSGLNAARATRGALPGGKTRTDRTRRDPSQGAGPRRRPPAASSPSRRSSSASSIRSTPMAG